jgi:hypothetical protein
MEHLFVSNGHTQLVLVPENEMDTLLLDRIMSSGDIEIQYIRQPVGILGRSVKDGVIIRPKLHKNIEDIKLIDDPNNYINDTI